MYNFILPTSTKKKKKKHRVETCSQFGHCMQFNCCCIEVNDDRCGRRCRHRQMYNLKMMPHKCCSMRVQQIEYRNNSVKTFASTSSNNKQQQQQL